MIRRNFLSPEDRADLIALARDGSCAHRLARRANALVLLDDGWSCSRVASALFLDDDTIRRWRALFLEDGLEGLTRFDAGGSSSRLSTAQEEALISWVATKLPRSTREVGAYIAREFGVVYESRSGLIALLHRLGLEYSKPETIGRKLDVQKQKAFIEAYENLLNSMGSDEAVLFMVAVHPTHAARPVGCWAPAKENLAIQQNSGRQRLNIHGAIDLETGKTAMIDVETVDAASTIRLTASDRGDVSAAGDHPCLSRQRPLSPCRSRAGMAGGARQTDQVALHSRLLPAFKPNRTVVGRHAQAPHPQQILCHIPGVRRRDAGISGLM